MENNLNFKSMSISDLVLNLIQCEEDRKKRNYHSHEEYLYLRSKIFFIKNELENRRKK